MAITLPVEPGLLLVLATSVGDDDRGYRDQLTASEGEVIVAPLTFTAAAAAHFDFEGQLRMWPGGEPTPEGGSADQFHAEQHFEYHRPLRAGTTLTGHTYPGQTWHRAGRAGRLVFAEIITDFVDDDGGLCVRSRKVGVRVHRDDDA